MVKTDLTIVSDPLLSEFGPTRPTILVADCLSKHGFNVRVVSTVVAQEIKESFEDLGITVFEIATRSLPISESLAWLKEWLTEASYSGNSRKTPHLEGVVLNFSNVIPTRSRFWYAQGPPSITLSNIETTLSWHYRLVYTVIAPILAILDKRMTHRFAESADKVVVNSEYLRSVYEKLGVDVSAVIYPPLDCELFRPTSVPNSSSYVLTYFGKETKLSTLKKLADLGVNIKIFGGKMTVPRQFHNHPHLSLLGRISNLELVRLYSNASFTIFPFLDEPFGYIPIESMACGTPVLTFDSQGPSETVIDGVTGWLAEDDRSLIETALQVWKRGYNSSMRSECRERSLMFDKRKIGEKWVDLLT